jgi:hypothetical protein
MLGARNFGIMGLDAIGEAELLEDIAFLFESRYDHIDFSPPKEVRREAARGLRWHKKYGRGGTSIGIGRARDLASGKSIKPSTIKRMVRFFKRRYKNRNNHLDSGRNGMIAWLLWGGDAGYKWAKRILAEMKAADQKVDEMALDAMSRSLGLMESLIHDHGITSPIEVADYVGFEESQQAGIGMPYQIAIMATLVAGPGGRTDAVSIEIPDFVVPESELQQKWLTSDPDVFENALVFQFTQKIVKTLVVPEMKKAIEKRRETEEETLRYNIRDVLRAFRLIQDPDEPDYDENYIDSSRYFDVMLDTVVDRMLLEYRLKGLKQNRWDEDMSADWMFHEYYSYGGNSDKLLIWHLYNAIQERFERYLVSAIRNVFMDLDIKSKVRITRKRDAAYVKISGPGGSQSIRAEVGKTPNKFVPLLTMPTSSNNFRIKEKTAKRGRRLKWVDDQNFEDHVLRSIQGKAKKEVRSKIMAAAKAAGFEDQFVDEMIELMDPW